MKIKRKLFLKKNNSEISHRILFVVLMTFLIIPLVTFSNTTGGGGTGIFDQLFDLLGKLIADFRRLIALVGVLGVLVAIIGEILMPDMQRTLKIAVTSLVALAIGLGAELWVQLTGGSMLAPEFISQAEYVLIRIGA